MSFKFCIDKFFTAVVGTRKGLVKIIIWQLTMDVVVIMIMGNVFLLDKIFESVNDFLLTWCGSKSDVGSILSFQYIKFKKTFKLCFI